MNTKSGQTIRLRKALLYCGLLSSLLYILTLIIGGFAWNEYDSASLTVSELFAFDAPSAPLVIPLLIVYAILIYAFGWGVWKSAGGKRSLQIAGVLIAAKELFGLVATIYARMHMRGIETTITDTLHIVMTAVGTLLCMLPAMGFAASASGRKFRYYTIATMIIFLVFGILAGMESPKITENLPTPFLGIYERINILGYMLWIVVLAIVLLRKTEDGRQRAEDGVEKIDY